MMTRITPLVLPAALAFAVVAVGVYYEGILTERWFPNRSERLDRFTARLELAKKELMSFDDWKGTDTEVDPEQFKASHATACMSRDYENSEGDMVSAFLVSATGRHAALHTPDRCYRAAGFRMERAPHRRSIACGLEPPPEFATTTFLKEETTGTQRLRIFWAFSEDGQWGSPVWQKRLYGAKPALYKLYLIEQVRNSDSSAADSVGVQFAKDFLPALNKVLFSPDKADAGATP